jgi:voltage-gated potassium channel
LPALTQWGPSRSGDMEGSHQALTVRDHAQAASVAACGRGADVGAQTPAPDLGQVQARSGRQTGRAILRRASLSHMTRIHRPRLQRFLLALAVPFCLLVVGTLGYRMIEGWPLADALYMTVITITTVGYREVHELGGAGRAFTMFLALGGVFTIFYAASEVIRLIVSGEVRTIVGRQRMERSLAEFKDHRIVCGLGRMGRLVCHEFSSMGLPFVVVDRLPELVDAFRMPHGIAVQGDATSDELLRRVGVERARALVTVAASDADNLYITMSARLLNERLYIVARAEDEGAETKLIRAGANRVVSPYVIGGQRVAQAVLRPSVVDFIELATRSEHLDLQIEEVAIAPGSRFAGQSVKDSGIRYDLGIIIVAIKKTDGTMVFNPASQVVIEQRDVLITLGDRKGLDRLATLAQPA